MAQSRENFLDARITWNCNNRIIRLLGQSAWLAYREVKAKSWSNYCCLVYSTNIDSIDSESESKVGGNLICLSSSNNKPYCSALWRKRVKLDGLDAIQWISASFLVASHRFTLVALNNNQDQTYLLADSNSIIAWAGCFSVPIGCHFAPFSIFVVVDASISRLPSESLESQWDSESRANRQRSERHDRACVQWRESSTSTEATIVARTAKISQTSLRRC